MFYPKGRQKLPPQILLHCFPPLAREGEAISPSRDEERRRKRERGEEEREKRGEERNISPSSCYARVPESKGGGDAARETVEIGGEKEEKREREGEREREKEEKKRER